VAILTTAAEAVEDGAMIVVDEEGFEVEGVGSVVVLPMVVEVADEVAVDIVAPKLPYLHALVLVYECF
jgi:hypothetical protein